MSAWYKCNECIIELRYDRSWHKKAPELCGRCERILQEDSK